MNRDDVLETMTRSALPAVLLWSAVSERLQSLDAERW